ncbi:hypothetical protein [Curtobacterium sp. PhB115]|uniref:hypothetical protein n=1 Tax=Curtobacterium sp. PhB115 TaxID=2485173 RepID=UPI000F4B254A|nr:hypothetical protein [Curtobacterium sp. PhB115]ROP74023.1 hypothetical protein EDF19_0096 [Curtobacterium sp. PhB115]
MNKRSTLASATGLLVSLALTACAGGPSIPESRTPSSSPSISRATAEARTGEVQRRITDAFPSGSIATNDTGRWTLLACSDTEVSAGGGASITLTREVDVDATYGAITEALRGDDYTSATTTTRKGATRLTVTGQDDDQYLITIYNDTRTVQISSFSPCFPGSLTDE